MKLSYLWTIPGYVLTGQIAYANGLGLWSLVALFASLAWVDIASWVTARKHK